MDAQGLTLFLGLTESLAITFLGLTVPIFVFSVTLLGNAINKAKEEEIQEDAIQNKEFEDKILKAQKDVDKARKEGKSSSLETLQTTLNDLKNQQNISKKRQKNIKRNYSYLGYQEAVIYPGLFLLISLLFDKAAYYFLIVEDNYLAIFVWFLALLSICTAIFRIFKSLKLVQKVAILSDDTQQNRMTDALKNAFAIHDKQTEIDLFLSFKTNDFKLVKNSEATIKFAVFLVNGKFAKNAEVWFFVPDDFVFVKPKEDKSFKQDSSFRLPLNKKTITVQIGNVNTGTNSNGSIIFKTPDTKGRFKIYYEIVAEGYNSERFEQEIEILG